MGAATRVSSSFGFGFSSVAADVADDHDLLRPKTPPHTFSFLSRVLCHDNRVAFDASCIETGIQCSPIEPADRGSNLNRGKKKKEENGGAVSRPRSKLRRKREDKGEKDCLDKERNSRGAREKGQRGYGAKKRRLVFLIKRFRTRLD